MRTPLKKISFKDLRGFYTLTIFFRINIHDINTNMGCDILNININKDER
jgi:hypothetical protein